MTDDTARVARLMKVVETLVAELNRQGLAEIVADRGFDPIELAIQASACAVGMNVVKSGLEPDHVHLAHYCI
jgi:hypothetical protein